MKQPRPQSISFSDQIGNIEQELVKIPQYQASTVNVSPTPLGGNVSAVGQQ